MERDILLINQSLQAKIDQIEKLQEQLREQAVRDPLTALFNRRYLDETLERDFAFMKRNGQEAAFAMLDLDHFKEINDAWGHQAGDEVLKRLARLMLEATRKSDIACRYGGEEFLLVLNGASPDAAYAIVNGIRDSFKSTGVEWNGAIISATLSGGISFFPRNGNTPRELIAQSDAALYRAKKAGRDCIVCAEH